MTMRRIPLSPVLSGIALGTLMIAFPLALAQTSATSAGPASPAQNAAVQLPTFAVVSVKQNKSATNQFRSVNSPEGIIVTNASLLMIIRAAYGLFNSLDDKFIGVPDWAKTEKYDIEAKVDPSDLETLHRLNPDQHSLMLQALLADRFKLRIHKEIREQPVYDLIVAKNGSKIKEAKPGDTYPNGLKDPYDGRTGAGVTRWSEHGLAGQAIPMSTLAVMLTQIVGRTVEDRTALPGGYDFTLNWEPETPAASSPGPDPSTSIEDSGPSIFSAIREQLGLRLEPAKGPVSVLVIDHIERPSAN